MQKFQFLLLTYWLESPGFLTEVHLMLLELCLCMVIFKTCFLNTQSHFTLKALHEHFVCHTPGFTHVTPQCVSDGIGQCLLPQTSSLMTCDSTLDGLPNGLGTLCSAPACANIFLVRVYRKISM